MHPAITYELAKARIADLRHQARARRAGPRRHTPVPERAAVAHDRFWSASERRSGRIQRQLGEGMVDNDSRAAVISRQGIVGAPTTRHQPASGHRPGQQWPWIGAEEPR
jgi:hypothetical protein